jgi:catechol 2,3-dioxygenase-like lactoylglutathione lyase family enzyme
MSLISGAHVMIFTRNEDSDRAFLRDVLEELGIHGGEQNDVHQLYFMTESLDAAIEKLAGKGVECGEPFTASWGRATKVPLPGGGKIGLYEPRHARP